MKTKTQFNTFLLAASVILTMSSAANALVTAPGTTRIDIEMSAQEKTDLGRSERTDVPTAHASIYEAGQLKQKTLVTIHSRGQSSLKEFSRKNMEAKSLMKDETNEKIRTGSVSAKEMILSASPEDRLVMKNMLVYRIYDAVQVPTMETTYAEVVINGESQGLYMTSKSPAEHLLQKEDAEIVFRRRYNDEMELKKAKKSLSAEDIKSYQDKLTELYKIAAKEKGEALVAGLQKNFNLDHYLNWLAVNYIVSNSDYLDEVFFFAKKDKSNEIKFDIFPWDLDDSFSDKMHMASLPGAANYKRQDRAEYQMLNSFESRLDQAVSEDSVLISKYFTALEGVANTLTDAKVDEIFAKVRGKLMPYLADTDILNGGLQDIEKAAHDPIEVISQFEIKKSYVKSQLAKVRAELAEIKTEEPGERAKKLRFKRLSNFEQKLVRKFTAKKQ